MTYMYTQAVHIIPVGAKEHPAEFVGWRCPTRASDERQPMNQCVAALRRFEAGGHHVSPCRVVVGDEERREESDDVAEFPRQSARRRARRPSDDVSVSCLPVFVSRCGPARCRPSRRGRLTSPTMPNWRATTGARFDTSRSLRCRSSSPDSTGPARMRAAQARIADVGPQAPGGASITSPFRRRPQRKSLQATWRDEQIRLELHARSEHAPRAPNPFALHLQITRIPCLRRRTRARIETRRRTTNRLRLIQVPREPPQCVVVRVR